MYLDETILIARTVRDTLIASTTNPMPAAQWASTILGCKLVRGLQSVRFLSTLVADDQAQILVRSLTETALDLEYLSLDSTRIVGGKKPRSIHLDRATKGKLFMTHYDIIGARLFRTSKYPQQDSLASAIDLRTRLGLPTRSPYWHCTHTEGLLAELEREAAAQGTTDPSLVARMGIFCNVSSYTHSHPHDRPYLAVSEDESRLESVEVHSDPEPYALSVAFGLAGAMSWDTNDQAHCARRATELQARLTDATKQWQIAVRDWKLARGEAEKSD